ncbi:MAG: glycosyltransferase family 2 protein [Sulfitobacter sp.]
MKLRLFAVCGLLILAATVPVIGAAACAVILVLQIALMCLRPVITRLPTPTVRARETFDAPVFSVHVATHSEPPDMVIRTLHALLDQDWPADKYEIIVMDNNTSDDALWKPVQAFCDEQVSQCKFLHQNDVQGAKAGALNIALDHTRVDASHIVTVDADYIVGPDFLSTAASALALTGADYVQFPQSYMGVSGAAAGVDAELEEYFRSNAVVADDAEAVLLTGTLCVISKTALAAAGGWSGSTTTEDAEVGVRLCNAGFTGRFINQIVGRGLLPFSLADLETQRYRWCSGNFQTLLRHCQTILTFKGSMSLHKRLVIVSQLTAWFNLALIPTVVLLAAVLLGREHSVAAVLSACVVLLSFFDVALRIIGRGVRDDLELAVICHALACRFALAPKSAKATFDAILGEEFKFLVTKKHIREVARGVQIPIWHLALFVISLFVLVGLHPTHSTVIAALLALMLPLPAALLTDKSLHDYRKSISASQEVTL